MDILLKLLFFPIWFPFWALGKILSVIEFCLKCAIISSFFDD